MNKCLKSLWAIGTRAPDGVNERIRHDIKHDIIRQMVSTDRKTYRVARRIREELENDNRD